LEGFVFIALLNRNMKKIILILLTLFSFAFVHAQKNFQGEITYRLHVSNDSKGDATLKILFGDQKIKILFREKETYDKDAVIVLLDSGASFVLNTEAKTYKKKMMVVDSTTKSAEKRSIAGYNTTPLFHEDSGLEKFLGGFIKTSNVVFYLADSLFYTVPTRFEGNPELVTIRKNRIILGAEITISNEYSNNYDSLSRKSSLISVEATDIKAMPISDDAFRIPADYVDYKTIGTTETEPKYDSVTVEPLVDTTVVTYPSKKGSTKKPAGPNRSKNATKPAADKRKE